MEATEPAGTHAGQAALAAWADATYQALLELSETTLEAEAMPADVVTPPEGMAFVSLSSGSIALQIGIGSTKEGLAGLSRAMLMMEPDEAIELDEIVDAIGELANVLAGGVKTRFGKQLSIGLPLFVEGAVHHQRIIELCSRHAMVGEHPVTLMIARQRSC